LRQRLGLSAAAMGALLGVTAQSVYKWEDGKARPRSAQLQAIAAIRKLGKREAAQRLSAMEGGQAAPRVTH
jgi:DNA-binding transcriptional regulator YiaG